MAITILKNPQLYPKQLYRHLLKHIHTYSRLCADMQTAKKKNNGATITKKS